MENIKNNASIKRIAIYCFVGGFAAFTVSSTLATSLIVTGLSIIVLVK